MPSFKIFLILILLYPLLNFGHELGHWVGAKLTGFEPQMKLQRVDIANESRASFLQKIAYTWAGPSINYSIMLASLAYPPLLPVAFVLAAHRFGPNLFSLILHFKGSTNFTTDETKLFPKKYRLIVLIFFSALYFILSLFFLLKWAPNVKLIVTPLYIFTFSLIWFGYLIFLDNLDQKFSS